MDRYLVSQFELENPFPKIDISCYLEIFDKKMNIILQLLKMGIVIGISCFCLLESLNLRKTRSYLKIFGLDVIW